MNSDLNLYSKNIGVPTVLRDWSLSEDARKISQIIVDEHDLTRFDFQEDDLGNGVFTLSSEKMDLDTAIDRIARYMNEKKEEIICLKYSGCTQLKSSLKFEVNGKIVSILVGKQGVRLRKIQSDWAGEVSISLTDNKHKNSSCEITLEGSDPKKVEFVRQMLDLSQKFIKLTPLQSQWLYINQATFLQYLRRECGLAFIKLVEGIDSPITTTATACNNTPTNRPQHQRRDSDSPPVTYKSKKIDKRRTTSSNSRTNKKRETKSRENNSTSTNSTTSIEGVEDGIFDINSHQSYKIEMVGTKDTIDFAKLLLDAQMSYIHDLVSVASQIDDVTRSIEDLQTPFKDIHIKGKEDTLASVSQ